MFLQIIPSRSGLVFTDHLKAKQNQRKRIRVCTHKDVNENIHEMLIVHNKDTYVRPHKHKISGESIHILEGKCNLLLFNNNSCFINRNEKLPKILLQ